MASVVIGSVDVKKSPLGDASWRASYKLNLRGKLSRFDDINFGCNQPASYNSRSAMSLRSISPNRAHSAALLWASIAHLCLPDMGQGHIKTDGRRTGFIFLAKPTGCKKT